MTRVTECLDFFKPEWYTKWVLKVGLRESNAISKKAQKIGTRLHQIIASNIFVADKKDTKEVKNCLIGFNAWRERYSVDQLHLLQRVTDESIQLSGEPDALWGDTLIDWKASQRISPQYFFQLGGYRRLGYECKRLGVVRLDKESGDFQFVTNEDLGLSIASCVDAFEAAFKHYQYYKYIQDKLGDSYD